MSQTAARSGEDRRVSFGDGGPSSNAQVLLLPDTKYRYYLQISRRPFVKDTTKITLSNGVVQSVQRVRPSLVQGIIGVPKTIVGAVAPIPLQIRQSQMNNAQAVDNTLKAEADIKKASGQ
jgi:hypothetical protein